MFDSQLWYAAQTRSNFEKRVAVELEAKGVESYLPAYQEVHQWKDRRKRIDVPLFPGYVFVRFVDWPAHRLAVLQTAGVLRLLGHGGELEPVDNAELDAVRLLLKSNSRCVPHPFLREGARVRVKRGALAGIEGILTRFKNQSRLVISVTLLAQSVALEVDMAGVEVLETRVRRQTVPRPFAESSLRRA